MAGTMFDGAPAQSPHHPGSDILVRSSANARPMRLSEGRTCSPPGSAALHKCLAAGCACGHDTATLARRVNAGGAKIVALQCDFCGVNLAKGMKRADHPDWDNYPEWDKEKRPAYWRRWNAETAARRAQWVANKREENEAFYQSLEWAALRDAVMRRSNYACEKCGKFPAHTAHHTTYALGMLAPIGTMLAVCDPCHRRPHTRGDPWHDPALPAHYSVTAGDWWAE